jgi:hypothetical protein
MGRMHGPHLSGTKKHHRDTTHRPIAAVLEAFGWTVVDMSAVGALVPGYPDMTIGQGGITDHVQAKTGNEPLSPAEEAFHRAWRGRPIVILRSTSEAESWARRERHERSRQSEAKALSACVHRTPG